ncbi:MAG: hypothetical protein AAF492_25660 [Verrucomicrobiota bacterium]
MAERKQSNLVHGVTTLHAIQRAAATRPMPERRDIKQGETASETIETKPQPGSTGIGKTVVPTRIDLICPDCDYGFHINGRVKETTCPKCRGLIDLKDYRIEGVWNRPLRTGGRIEITERGIIEAGSYTASEILLNGKIESGSLSAYKCIELGPRADCDVRIRIERPLGRRP